MAWPLKKQIRSQGDVVCFEYVQTHWARPSAQPVQSWHQWSNSSPKCPKPIGRCSIDPGGRITLLCPGRNAVPQKNHRAVGGSVARHGPFRNEAVMLSPKGSGPCNLIDSIQPFSGHVPEPRLERSLHFPQRRRLPGLHARNHEARSCRAHIPNQLEKFAVELPRAVWRRRKST